MNDTYIYIIDMVKLESSIRRALNIQIDNKRLMSVLFAILKDKNITPDRMLSHQSNDYEILYFDSIGRILHAYRKNYDDIVHDIMQDFSLKYIRQPNDVFYVKDYREFIKTFNTIL